LLPDKRVSGFLLPVNRLPNLKAVTSHLVGPAEVAAMMGISRQRVDQLASTYEDFPAPEVVLATGRVWARSAIERWIAAHPKRPPGPRRR
jgi:predicted DNA-binding transcriptional regulator AlpA